MRTEDTNVQSISYVIESTTKALKKLEDVIARIDEYKSTFAKEINIEVELKNLLEKPVKGDNSLYDICYTYLEMENDEECFSLLNCKMYNSNCKTVLITLALIRNDVYKDIEDAKVLLEEYRVIVQVS